jgi:uncharacterized membrane protein YdjX (TVP38/TMEM64 family)
MALPPITERPSAQRPAWRRFLPILALVAAIVLVFATGLHRYLGLDALREHHETLQAFVAGHWGLAALTLVAVYAVATALSIPGALILTVTSGLLFECLWGTVLAVLGGGLGATLLYLTARTAFGDVLARRAGGLVRKLEAGFKENALSYLLVLRLIPVFPFWLVNLAAAVLGVPLTTYVLATFIGIIPGAYVYANVGDGLGSVLEQGGELSLRGALTPEVIIGLVGLAVLALLPVAYKRLRGSGGVAPS